jgi:hypothetical protein
MIQGSKTTRQRSRKQRQKHFINQKGQMQRSPFSAKTRSADDAENIRQALKDSHDPDKVKIKQMEEANKRRDEAEAQKTVTFEEAVGRFLQYEHDHPRNVRAVSSHGSRHSIRDHSTSQT